jgi:CRISPR-associated protein Csb2
LLRALVSAWFRAHPGKAPNEHCIGLIESLGRDLPEIGFTKVSFGQTVHWQPNYGAADAQDKAEARYKNTRHENHFAAIHGPVFFRWPNVKLSLEQSQILETLLAEITYFGRAESLCHAEVYNSELPSEIGWCTDTGGRKISASCRDVFCPNPADFRSTDLWSRRTAELAPHSTDAPAHFVDSLLDSDMNANGAGWRSYRMPSDWPHKRLVRTPRTARPKRKPASGMGAKVAHYLCFSLQCRVPLLPKFAVSLSEQFRRAANFHLAKICGDGTPSFALSGHERPSDAEGDHQHAFFLPMEKKNDRSGCLQDLHIWCPYGFTKEEIESLLRINRLNWGGGEYPVRPVLTALSKEPPMDLPFSTGKVASKLWRSASPFVPPRYFYRGSGSRAKLKERDRPELQLAECLRKAGIQVPGEIRRYPLANGAMKDDKPRWDIVRAELGEETAAGALLVAVPTHRNGSSNGRAMEQRIGGFFEIEFAEPVALPQPAFGHSCHFGLGLFIPVKA